MYQGVDGLEANDGWKAIPSKLQLAYKHSLTERKLTLLHSPHGEDDGIIGNKISETYCFL